MLKTTIREIIRHTLRRLGLQNALTVRRRRTDPDADAHLRLPHLQDRFSYIYAHSVWTRGEVVLPRSGHGSTLQATIAVREHLPVLLDSLSVASLLDIGCGDFTWMQSVPLRQHYVGADIVPSVIEDNVRRYGTARRQFVLIDATRDALPAADAVLCREVLFHLSFADGAALLRNVVASGARYLIATTDGATQFNADIASGDFRIVNLERRPFSFGKPIASIADDGVQASRSLGVWNIATLPQARDTRLHNGRQ